MTTCTLSSTIQVCLCESRRIRLLRRPDCSEHTHAHTQPCARCKVQDARKHAHTHTCTHKHAHAPRHTHARTHAYMHIPADEFGSGYTSCNPSFQCMSSKFRPALLYEGLARMVCERNRMSSNFHMPTSFVQFHFARQ